MCVCSVVCVCIYIRQQVRKVDVSQHTLKSRFLSRVCVVYVFVCVNKLSLNTSTIRGNPAAGQKGWRVNTHSTRVCGGNGVLSLIHI